MKRAIKRKLRRYCAIFLPCVAGVVVSPQVLADLYRCAAPTGAVSYQQQPCQGTDKRRTIDDNELELQKRRRVEDLMHQPAHEQDRNEQKRLEKIKEQIGLIRSCLAKEFECDAVMYSQSLKCMSPHEVADVMGVPKRTQHIAGKTYIYYDVPAHNGKRFETARLQLIVGFCNDLPALNPMNKISEINVY